METVVCNRCGWVHMGVSWEFANTSIKQFNDYYHTLTEEKQQFYYGGKPATWTNYLRCGTCGNHYSDFRVAVSGDAPNGCTLSPIVHFSEAVVMET